MPYSLQWRSPALPYTQKQTPINVPAGSVVSNAASLRFTGKGAPGYGKIQQENQLLLLENFAGATEPPHATVGQTWYDTQNTVLKVCVSTAPDPITWHSLNSTQITNIGDGPPSPAKLGDTWYSRTGAASGIMYTYTGIGRFPQIDWDASATPSGLQPYWPAANTSTLAFMPNKSTFSTQAFNDMYICGYGAGVPSDSNGTISIDGSVITVPRGTLFTSQQSSSAYVLWDRGNTLTSSQSTAFYQIRQLHDGQWQYDNMVTWVNFEPLYISMFVIGVISVAEANHNAAPGIGSAYPWSTGLHILDVSQVPATLVAGAVGGWEQQFPTVERIAGRDEYDYMYSLVAALLGDENGYGGSGAITRSIQYLTNFQVLDASSIQRLRALAPQDLNVVASGVPLDFFKVEPASTDWDLLLAAAKYALSRLELPVAYAQNISGYPFITDGRQAPAVLQGFSATDPQYPDLHRMASRKQGSLTLARLYEETINALQAAIQNRYLLKGMMGASGVNPVFSPTVTVTDVAAPFTYSGQFIGGVSHGLKYRFDYNDSTIKRFFFAGGALMFTITHSAASTTSDVDLKAIADQHGRIRVTADQTFMMDGSAAPTLGQTPVPVGYTNVTAAGTTLVSITIGTATLTVHATVGDAPASNNSFINLYADISTTGATTGATTIQCSYISDAEMYTSSGLTPGPARVYPAPLATTGADKTGPFA